jgi:hypothetical protein
LETIYAGGHMDYPMSKVATMNTAMKAIEKKPCKGLLPRLALPCALFLESKGYISFFFFLSKFLLGYIHYTGGFIVTILIRLNIVH